MIEDNIFVAGVEVLRNPGEVPEKNGHRLVAGVEVLRNPGEVPEKNGHRQEYRPFSVKHELVAGSPGFRIPQTRPPPGGRMGVVACP